MPSICVGVFWGALFNSIDAFKLLLDGRKLRKLETLNYEKEFKKISLVVWTIS